MSPYKNNYYNNNNYKPKTIGFEDLEAEEDDTEDIDSDFEDQKWGDIICDKLDKLDKKLQDLEDLLKKFNNGS